MRHARQVWGIAIYVAIGAAAQGQDTVPVAQWTLGRTDADVGDDFVAWLTVRGARNGKVRHDTVTLAPGSPHLWFAQSAEQCATTSDTKRVLPFTSARDTVLTVCGRATERESVHLVALVAHDEPSAQTEVASQTLTFSTPLSHDLPQWLVACLTTLIGLVAGAALSAWQRRGERADKAADAALTQAALAGDQQRRVIDQFVSTIVPQLSTAAATVEAATRPETAPTNVEVAAIGQILDATTGLAKFFAGGDENADFVRLRDLYALLLVHNESFNDTQQAPEPGFSHDDAVRFYRDVAAQVLSAIQAPDAAGRDKAKQAITQLQARRNAAIASGGKAHA